MLCCTVVTGHTTVQQDLVECLTTFVGVSLEDIVRKDILNFHRVSSVIYMVGLLPFDIVTYLMRKGIQADLSGRQ